MTKRVEIEHTVPVKLKYIVSLDVLEAQNGNLYYAALEALDTGASFVRYPRGDGVWVESMIRRINDGPRSA